MFENIMKKNYPGNKRNKNNTNNNNKITGRNTYQILAVVDLHLFLSLVFNDS